jgi:hypothetical protein
VRVLANEEDTARRLVKSLNDEQRKAAIFNAVAPKEILTEAKRHIMPLETSGIAAAKLNADQTALLMNVVHEYVQRVRPELAEEDLKKIKAAGVEKIQFAWAGGIEKGESLLPRPGADLPARIRQHPERQ